MVSASAGAFTVTGTAATLNYSGAGTPQAAYMAASLFYEVDTDPIYFTVTD
jgi:hypothetical protein